MDKDPDKSSTEQEGYIGLCIGCSDIFLPPPPPPATMQNWFSVRLHIRVSGCQKAGTSLLEEWNFNKPLKAT